MQQYNRGRWREKENEKTRGIWRREIMTCGDGNSLILSHFIILSRSYFPIRSARQVLSLAGICIPFGDFPCRLRHTFDVKCRNVCIKSSRKMYHYNDPPTHNTIIKIKRSHQQQNWQHQAWYCDFILDKTDHNRCSYVSVFIWFSLFQHRKPSKPFS